MSEARVLIVDDEQAIRETVCDMLDMLGISAMAVENGEQAVETVTDNPNRFNLILLDYSMPGMGGEAAYGKLSEISPNTPIYIFTGYGDSDETKRLIDQGAFGLLPKRFRLDELQNVLNTHSIVS